MVFEQMVGLVGMRFGQAFDSVVGLKGQVEVWLAHETGLVGMRFEQVFDSVVGLKGQIEVWFAPGTGLVDMVQVCSEQFDTL